jgi:ATP-dependent DNA helicase RecQ
LSQAQHILQQYWHYDQFRPLQEEIINTLLDGKDCVALLPTGAGKSICYQVPALLLEGITLVVSPLVSLMQDQVAQLQARGIPAAYIHGGLNYQSVADLLTAAAKDELKLLYLSPERIQSRQFKEALPDIHVSLIAIDEAHCISQWGHDFRPEFLQIASLRTACKSAPIIALTASATEDVLLDIQTQLKIENAQVFRTSFRRDNIFYQVQYTENKYQYIAQYCAQQQQCGIIYCRSRRKTEELVHLLQQHQVSAVAYHAGMSKEDRTRNQTDWMQHKVAVIVATTAFGMGIDKPDVRFVIHFDAPEYLEAYYQETGRAGRDGLPATAITLFNFADIERIESSTAIYFPPETYLRQVYQNVCDFLQVPAGVELEAYFDFDLPLFLTNFKLEALPATHALRLLSQEGLWTISESLSRPATVLFIADRTVLDGIAQRYPNLSYVATGLLRQYSGMFHHPAAINVFALARFLKMKKEDVALALQQLDKMQIIEYQKTKEGPQLFFHHYRVPSQHLILNHKRINRLRAQHQHRIDAMLGFLNNTVQCFNTILLAYFGETSHANCQHCAYCAEQTKEGFSPKYVQRLILSLLHTHQALPLQELIQMTGAEAGLTTQLIRQLIDQSILMINEEGDIVICSA